MLIQFRVRNFLSFKDEALLSLSARSTSENPNAVFIRNRRKYLKSIAILGANEYGKTNLIKALFFFKWFILNSYNDSLSESLIGVIPFNFNLKTMKQPSFFEIVFTNKKNIQYRYGFCASKEKIINEWLYVLEQSDKPREKLFFKRDSENIELGASYKKFNVFSSKKNVLFLTKLGLEIEEVDRDIINWFRKDCNIIRGYNDNYAKYTRNELVASSEFKREVLSYLKAVGSSIENLEIEEKLGIFTHHHIYDENGKISGFQKMNLEEESLGTRHFFNLLGPIIDTLKNGKTLIVDELESSLHPNLLRFVVQLFNSKNNKENAQLVFSTHNPIILDKDEIGLNILRRDQLYFVDKNEKGESEIFSLIDFSNNQKKIRKDENYLKNYLIGKYGAVPFIDEELHA